MVKPFLISSSYNIAQLAYNPYLISKFKPTKGYLKTNAVSFAKT